VAIESEDPVTDTITNGKTNSESDDLATEPERPRRVVGHPSIDERVAAGKAARQAVPRSSHAELSLDDDRADHAGDQRHLPRVADGRGRRRRTT
jgi:hypothetical protein